MIFHEIIMYWISCMDHVVTNISSYLCMKSKENGTRNEGNQIPEITAVSLKFHPKVNLHKICRNHGKSDRYTAIGNPAFSLVLKQHEH